MDWEAGKQQIIDFIKKYRYVLLILLTGIFIMLLPDTMDPEPQLVQVTEASPPDLQIMLSDILSQISGVGKAEVLLTEASGQYTLYQTDTDTSQNDVRQDTVIITNGNREEIGLIKQMIPPVYRGAIVVCQGADSASVRLSVVDAVKSVTGLSADCITVLKMK